MRSHFPIERQEALIKLGLIVVCKLAVHLRLFAKLDQFARLVVRSA